MPRLLLALALLVLGGCAAATPKPNQAAATKIVWVAQYGMTASPPPIDWVTGSSLNCGDGNAWQSYVFDPPLCVSGLSTWDPFNASVAWPAGAEFSTTSFAHELCHLRDGLLTNGDDLDPNHMGECFVSGGLVDKANEALAEVGL